MSDPFGDLLKQFEGLKDIMDVAQRKSEPDIQEAKSRVRNTLATAGKWITVEGIKKRTGLSERAALAALDALKREGIARRGNARSGVRVWRWV